MTKLTREAKTAFETEIRKQFEFQKGKQKINNYIQYIFFLINLFL